MCIFMRVHVGFALIALLSPLPGSAQRPSAGEVLAVRLAPTVTIYRDRYGIPHVWARTDAGATFGFGYAQAEDNFARLEDNFVRALGRAAEVYGEPALHDDRLNRALRIPQLARAEYGRMSPRMRSLLDGYAAGVNLWMTRHPAAPRRLLQRVEPWYPLAFIRYNYYQNGFAPGAGLDSREIRTAERDRERSSLGSNGWVVGPSRSASGHALLFIDPHLSYFGPGQVYEGHVHSAEGWDFSGYARLGFPFPYVGFNATLGWVSTDNAADVADLYAERFDRAGDPLSYRYGTSYRTAFQWQDTIRVRAGNGVDTRAMTFRSTHHGPIVAVRDGHPLALRMAKLDSAGWLDEWYAMTRARDVTELKRAMRPLAMLFGNVMAADARGHTWYLYNAAVPRRDVRFDWTQPLDGSDPATEWKGFHSLDELPQLLDPPSGWMQNCNSSPFQLTDVGNPDSARFPAYMVPEGNSLNPRARASRRILSSTPAFTFDEWARAGFDTRVDAIDVGLRDLFASSAEVPDSALRVRIAPAAALLRGWDGRSTVESVPMTLLYVASGLYFSGPQRDTTLTGRARALADALDSLDARFGRWQVGWGEVSRLQRRPDPDPSAPPQYDLLAALDFRDDLPSEPLAAVPGWLGAVFTAYLARAPMQKREYAVAGDTYVAIVEFGPRVRAAAVHTFGASGDPRSPHFADQAPLFARGHFRPAWFSLADIRANAERAYHPGDQ
jgi:penicillin amidase